MSGTQSQVSAGTQLVSRAEAAPFVRRVALVPGSPDSTPRSIQDMSRSNNRFSVLADPDDVNVEGGVSSGAVHTPVLASSTHKVETVAMDDGDTLVSEVAGSESEASSDIETDESDRESVHSIIRREEEDRAVPLVMEEVPEAIMTPGMHYGYGGSARSNYDPWDQGRFGKSGHSGHVPFVLDEGSGDEESAKVPPWCVPFSIAHRPSGNL